ncbi:hypothetical protein NW762_003942 [Fusarium torreyae]|uniref:Ethyl tert-butyl ether degradation EthD n=1 Tax=Fusarium torreyae TaxID=1237075 RepID=A0A9W8VKA7_9HYPO|nr:hypothetical protein NW762_003942 [Fusarium torreyae]
MATVAIQYPVGHEFDIEYYQKTHIPLVLKIWESAGLKSWEVIQLGGSGAYQVITILRWESLAAFQKAAAMEESKALKDDVKNFTTAVATSVVGETVAQG